MEQVQRKITRCQVLTTIPILILTAIIPTATTPIAGSMMASVLFPATSYWPLLVLALVDPVARLWHRQERVRD